MRRVAAIAVGGLLSVTALVGVPLATAASATLGAADAPSTCHGLDATIIGTDDPETLNGTDGADVISAGAGDDQINALGGADVVCGDAGRDTIAAGAGADEVYGGVDGDTIDPGSGVDVVDGGGTELYGDNLTYVSSPDAITVNAESATVDANGVTDQYLNIDTVTGSNVGDTFNGSSHEDYFLGAGGNDAMTGGAKDDYFYGGDGDDTIAGGPGNDVAWPGNGLDTVNDLEGNNEATDVPDNDLDPWVGGLIVHFGPGRDEVDSLGPTLHGSSGGGNDYLSIEAGFKRGTFSTGPGKDRAWLGAAAKSVTLNLGTGDDRFDARHLTANTSVDAGDDHDFLGLRYLLGRHGTSVTLGPDGGTTTPVVASLPNFEDVETGRWNDTIIGSADDNWIQTHVGDDNIDALGGNDHVDGDAGNDSCLHAEITHGCEIV